MAQYEGPLPGHDRFDCLPIICHATCRWPNGAGLAAYLGFNRKHFALREGAGAAVEPTPPESSTRRFANPVLTR